MMKLFYLLFVGCIASAMKTNFIRIMGQSLQQSLPITLTKSWDTWTFEENMLKRVEGVTWDGDNVDDDDSNNLKVDGWVDPASYDDLYFPSDLPLPQGRASIGVVVANGTPRYIMPSVILTLETPGRVWRNRGLCTLPRANRWIDLFGEFAPNIKNLKLFCFGQMAPDVRFLEDQDGSASWENILVSSEDSSTMLRPAIENVGLDIHVEYEALTKYLSSLVSLNKQFADGYHFIDIPISNNKSKVRIPRQRMKFFLTDLNYPSDLLSAEPEEIDSEAFGSLDIKISAIGPGGTSKFLPEAYVDLYEPGSII